MSDVLAKLPAHERERAVRSPDPPAAGALMKALLTERRFSDPDWVFERKLDGIRCLAVRVGADVRLRSRNDLSLNERYPEIAAALHGQRTDNFAIDGEVVAFAGSQTSFARLAQRARHRVPVYLYAFDVLWLDGWDVCALTLRARKRLLRDTLTFADPLRWTPFRIGAGEELYRQACRRGWEGLIAKRADSRYAGARSKDWLKLKCGHEQELVIGGFTAPSGAREHLGALLLGHYHHGELQYAGKVGTGFDRETLRDLGERLQGLAQVASPFADADRVPARGVTWIAPRLVAQIGFSEWTRDGRLRHPRFLGLRDDKAPEGVVREQSDRVGPGVSSSPDGKSRARSRVRRAGRP